MRADPVVLCGDKEVAITYTKRALLRLIVLARGATVRKAEIANLNETEEDHVASKIRYLREELEAAGCSDLIETIESRGYRADLDGWEVDAFSFEDAVKETNGFNVAELDQEVDPELARGAITKLEAALRLWTTNPGIDLPPDTGLELQFDRLRLKAEETLLLARLMSRDPSAMREAVQGLEHRTRHEPDASTWILLLRAYASLGNIEQTRKTWSRVIDYYKGKVPADVRQVGLAAINGTPGVRIGKRDSDDNDLCAADEDLRSGVAGASLTDVVRILGITTSSQLKLEGSHLAPLQCIRRTRSLLYFSGVLASKWVMEPVVRSEFDEMLSRLDKKKGDVRFLIINPKSESFRRLHELRKGGISGESLPHLRKLVDRHDSFQVRAFDSLPAFRIVVIDNDVVTFSPYRLPAESYQKSGHGWEAPHVVLDPLAPYPLAEAFQLLFLETWEKAIPISEVT
jgi:DNA-binding winged helix-turn-helix (wHTH) protein